MYSCSVVVFVNKEGIEEIWYTWANSSHDLKSQFEAVKGNDYIKILKMNVGC